jgi:indole-3-glycerol phosphate synthase
MARLGAPMGFLTDLTRRIRADLERHPLDDVALMSRAATRPPTRDFAAALAGHVPAVIAEVKRASPSAGSIDENADPSERASAYEAGGAAAVSVLTEPRHFDGSLVDLEAVRASVQVPVLRKDFLVLPSQLIESRAHGADAVLLITSCLNDDELTAMLAAASDLGLGVLLETHSDDDLERALETPVSIIGVNARDLETLQVDVGEALARIARVPRDRRVVMESGVSTPEQVRAAVDAGASGILVGEALMRAPDPRAALRTLIGEGSMS